MQLDKPAGLDRFANPIHEPMQEPKVVNRRQDWTEHLPGHEQMAEIRPAVSAASQAVAILLDRPGVDTMDGVPQLDGAGHGETGGVSAIAGWQHAIKKVNSSPLVGSMRKSKGFLMSVACKGSPGPRA